MGHKREPGSWGPQTLGMAGTLKHRGREETGELGSEGNPESCACCAEEPGLLKSSGWSSEGCKQDSDVVRQVRGTPSLGCGAEMNGGCVGDRPELCSEVMKTDSG